MLSLPENIFSYLFSVQSATQKNNNQESSDWTSGLMIMGKVRLNVKRKVVENTQDNTQENTQDTTLGPVCCSRPSFGLHSSGPCKYMCYLFPEAKNPMLEAQMHLAESNGYMG